MRSAQRSPTGPMMLRDSRATQGSTPGMPRCGHNHSFLACCRRHCLLALSIYRFCLASTTRTPGPCLPLLLSAPSKCAFCAVENCVLVFNASTCKCQSELVVFFMQVRKVFQRDARESVAKLGWTALFSMCAHFAPGSLESQLTFAWSDESSRDWRGSRSKLVWTCLSLTRVLI